MSRILTKTLIFLLLISGSGIPVPLHHCLMMNEDSLADCEMCAAEESAGEATDKCCETDEESGVAFTSDKNADCCQIKLIGGQVEILSTFKSELEKQVSVFHITNSTQESLSPDEGVRWLIPLCASPPVHPLLKSTVLRI